jgi:general secretion pathway protein E
VVSTVTALRNWGMSNQEIGVSLSVVVAQRLVRRLCPHCAQVGELSSGARRWLDSLELPAPERCWNAVGCEHCRHLGYFGLVGIFEVWHMDEQDYQWILEGVDEHALRARLIEKGHQPLLADGLQKAQDGITSLDELRGLGNVLAPKDHHVPWARETATA